MNEELRQYVERDLAYTKSLVSIASTSAEAPNEHTLNEIRALSHFRSVGLMHAPQLIECMSVELPPGIDQQYMIGGYAIFIFMTKLPGKQVEWEAFWSKTKEERNEIREAFKVALMDVWKQEIQPRDSAMRNLIWDEVEKTCYIVDFEDWDKGEIWDYDKYWYHMNPCQSWRIDEEHRPSDAFGDVGY